jgi:benzil reductase ((S)-benzoin forming)
MTGDPRGVFAKAVAPADVAGRVAIVTGASRGLGAGLAERFVELGMRVGMCARKRPEPPAFTDRHQVLSISADVRDASDLEGLCGVVAERFGKIDLWINNAGVIDPIGRLADVDPGKVAHQISVNVTGVANGSRAFARHVRRRPGGGVLVNVSSGAARTVHVGWAAYSASKAAVEQMTAVIAEEEAEHGLMAFALAPGMIDTDMQRIVREAGHDSFPSVDRFIAAKVSGSFNSTSWVADAVLELAFGEVEFESGSTVRVPDEFGVTDELGTAT